MAEYGKRTQLQPKQHPAVDYEAHENPPVGEQDDDAARLPKPFPEPEEPDENVDNSFSVFFPPHEGQVVLSSSSLRKHKNSKMFPHSVHLNSYIGTLLLLWSNVKFFHSLIVFFIEP